MGIYRLGLICGLACALVFTGGVTTAAGQQKPPREKARDVAIADPNQKFVPGELLVRFKPGASAEARASALSSQGAHVKRELSIPDLRLVGLAPGKDVHAAAAALNARADVAYAEPNWIFRSTAVPNDPRYANGELWGLNQASDADIDAPEAWDLTTGSGSVVVAVVDTGVAYDHPDLAPNIWQNPGELVDGIDNDGNGKVDDSRGWDFYGDGYDADNDPRDTHGHGTHVAGTIGARGNDGVGVTGVNWNVSIMPVRVLGPYGAPASMVTSGFAYAAAEGARVVNASLGCAGCYSQAMKDAIDAAPNTLFVVAAGNSAVSTESSPHYPCNYTSANLICVAATTKTDELASFSNWGTTSVDIAAPGTEISSTAPAWATLLYDSFEVEGGWTPGGTPNTWARTTETAASSGSWSITDSPGTSYAPHADNWMAMTNPVSLAGRQACKVQYQLKLDTEPDFDALMFGASTDNVFWYNLGGWFGSTADFPTKWFLFEEDISEWDGAPTFWFRFGFESEGGGVPHDGAYVDDVDIRCISTSYGPDDYSTKSGTSMASPHVAGVAALIFAKNPTETVEHAKSAILSGGDPLPSLSGKVVTGSRVNAFGSLSRFCGGRFATVLGTPGADSLVGTEGNDVIVGLGGNDTIDGGGGNDRICGGLGNDTLRGGPGNDTLTGDAGADTLDYSLAPAGVIANVQLGTTTGGDGTDTHSGMENVTGSASADTLVGNAVVNRLRGGDGNDWIRGAWGNDILTGGNGVDMLDYAEAFPGVTVSLATNTSSGAAGNDVLATFESVLGTSYTDTLYGDLNRNLLIGGPGEDTLWGGDGPDQLRGGAGNDVMHGEAGVDSLDYSTAGTGVTVSLTSNTATGGGGSDTFDGVESMFGSPHGDSLTGNGANNRIDGLAGDDFLYGLNGNDALIGGVGSDSLDGGPNTDSCSTGEVLISCES